MRVGMKGWGGGGGEKYEKLERKKRPRKKGYAMYAVLRVAPRVCGGHLSLRRPRNDFRAIRE